MECEVVSINQPNEKSLKQGIQDMLDAGWTLNSVNMTGDGFACKAYITFTR